MTVDFVASTLNIPCKSQMRPRGTITQNALFAQWKLRNTPLSVFTRVINEHAFQPKQKKTLA